MGRGLRTIKLRPVLFWFHLSIGISAGTFLFVIALTGVLLAFRPQVTAFAERAQLHVELPADGSVRMSLDPLAAKILEESPEALVTGLTLSAEPGSTVAFNLGRDKVVYIDPYRGTVLGTGAPRTRAFFQTVESLHRWFGFQGVGREAAKQVKGAVTLMFGLMILSGFYLWWPRQWSSSVFRSIAIPSRSLKGKQRDWNWHNAVGFWSAPWLLVIVLTGLVMAYPWANDLLYRLTGNEPPVRNLSTRPMEGSKPARTGEKALGSRHRDPDHGKEHPVSLDKFLAAVDQQAPGWKSAILRLPQDGKPEATVLVEEGSSSRPFTRGMMTLDASRGEVLKWEPYASQNPGRKLRLWARFVHTGEAGGWPGQSLAALAALGALFLIWTGLSLAWRRFLS